MTDAPPPPSPDYPSQPAQAAQPNPYASQNPYASSTPYAAAPAQKTNGLAIAALATGIAGLVLFFIVPVLISVSAVICGHISLSQLKRTGDAGRQMAVWGLVLGYIGVGVGIVGIGLFIAFFAFVATAGAYSTY